MRSFIFILSSSCIVFVSGLNTAATLREDQRLTKFVDFFYQFDNSFNSINGGTGITILAPTDDAFITYEQQDPTSWNKYTTRPEFSVHLQDIIYWNILPKSKLTIDDIFNGRRLYIENLIGNITIDQTQQTLDNVPATSIIESNIETSDSMIHILNEVIIPPHLGMNLLEQLFDDRSDYYSLTTMANLALHVGLDEQINDVFENGITMLVPPNRLFIRAEIDVNLLLTDEMKSYTRAFVLCHMITNGTYHEASVLNQEQEQFVVTSALGTSMWITRTEGQVRFQSTEILVPDQAAKNGLYHIIDYVLTPPMASDFAYFMPISTSQDTTDCVRFFRQTLLSSMDISVMFNSSITLWCPTTEAFTFFNNEDFNRLMEPIWVRHATEFLLNHMSVPAMSRAEVAALAPSTTITMLNGAIYELHNDGNIPIIKNGNEEARSDFGDLIAIDGYLHIVDTVLTPTAVSRSIYDQLNDNPDFSLLIENIDFVDLTDLVVRDLPLTVLAPDNNAWNRISGAVTSWEKPDIVKRHIFRGLLWKDVIVNASQITSVNGLVHAVEVRGEIHNEILLVGGAYIYLSDIVARNGVLHYIDRVIGVPYETVYPTSSPMPTLTPVPTPQPTLPTTPQPTGSVPVYLPPVQTPSPKPTPQPTDSPSIGVSSAPSIQPTQFVPAEILITVEFSIAIPSGVTPESLVDDLITSLDSLASQILSELESEKILIRKLAIEVRETSVASWEEVACPTESMVNNNFLCLDMMANMTIAAEDGMIDSTTVDKYEEFSTSLDQAVEGGRLDETLHSVSPDLPILVYRGDELPPTLAPTPNPSTAPSLLQTSVPSDVPTKNDTVSSRGKIHSCSVVVFLMHLIVSFEFIFC